MSDSLDTLNEEMRRIVRSELRPFERVLWASHPQPRQDWKHKFGDLVFGAVCFALGIGVLAIGIAGVTFAHKSFSYGAASIGLGTVFATLGAFGLASPLLDRRTRGRSAYVLTESRAIILDYSYGPLVSVESLPLATTRDIFCNRYGDGLGDLVFRIEKVPTRGGYSKNNFGFLAIRDLAKVEEIVRKLCGYEMVPSVGWIRPH